jgi:hypothetical protein
MTLFLLNLIETLYNILNYTVPKQNRCEESLGHLRIFPGKFLSLKL